MTRDIIVANVRAQNERLGKILGEFLDNVYTDGDKEYIYGFTRAIYEMGIITSEERDILRGVAEAEVGKP